MNRLICTNLQSISSSDLPPPGRSAKARILFVHSNALGFANQTRQLKRYAEEHPGIDAVHLDIARPLWAKVLGKSLPIPRGMDMAPYRLALIYKRLMNEWMARTNAFSRFDLVHFTTQQTALGMVEGARDLKWSVYVDSTAAAEVAEFGASPTAAEPMIRAEREIFCAVDLVVCMSRWAERSVQNQYGVTRTSVFPGCVELKQSASVQRDESTVQLLFVGNDFARKGGPELVGIHQRHLAGVAHLHIVSPRAVVPSGVRNVTVYPCVSREQLTGQIMPAMDLFVLPTKMDMSPWVVLESAAAGLPVIASDMAAIPEMVIDGRTGLLCKSGNWPTFTGALKELLANAPLRHEMGQRGRAHMLDAYNPDRVYPAMLDALVKLAQS